MCTGPTLNITAVSSTSTTISLKWTAADDRYNYYSTSDAYIVDFVMDDVFHGLETLEKVATITGLEPNTEYTIHVSAWTKLPGLDDHGPLANVTYRTQLAGE